MSKSYALIAPRLVLGFLLLLPAGLSGQTLASLPSGTVEIAKGTRRYVGLTVALDEQKLVMLLRDGRLKLLDNQGWQLNQVISGQFSPLSRDELRQRLQDEFGGAYQVTLTAHFLVVHPPGEYALWAEPIETVFQRYQHYFSARRITLSEPQFPLVAVVLNSRQEFDYFLQKYQPEMASPNVVGYYSPISNRLITYTQPGGIDSGGQTQATVIHEVVHQAAYNTGVHSRFASTPRWFCEGLAIMFEARGVNHSLQYPDRSDRIHRDWLSRLKSDLPAGQSRGILRDLVAQDQLFRRNTELAYAYAWGATFYLAETRPLEYADYIRSVTQRENFAAYDAPSRIEDFVRAFRADPDEIETRMSRFLLELE